MDMEASTINHLEYALRYSEIHKQIRAEFVLLQMNDSSYAS